MGKKYKDMKIKTRDRGWSEMGGRRNPIKYDIVKLHNHIQASERTDGQALPSMKIFMYGIMAVT
jgi:hypothetical protein